MPKRPAPGDTLPADRISVPDGDPDQTLAHILEAWLASKPRHYRNIQTAAALWLDAKGL